MMKRRAEAWVLDPNLLHNCRCSFTECRCPWLLDENTPAIGDFDESEEKGTSKRAARGLTDSSSECGRDEIYQR